MFKTYLLSSTALRSPDDESGVDPEIARKAAIEAERAKVVVTKIDIEDEKEEIETKEEDKDDEQKDESGEEEKEDKSEENEDKEDDKDVLKAQKKQERIDRKFKQQADKLKAAEKKVKDLEAKIAANPDKVLTEDDVAERAKVIAARDRMEDDYNRASNKLADVAQNHLKLKDREFNALVKEVLEELEAPGIPGEIVGALDDITNGGIVLAHLLKNVDEMEEYIALRNRPVKLGMELAKLATKLATPKAKKISQVPDPVEPLGGKSQGADRLAVLSNKKGNLTASEMTDYVQARNADIEAKRKNGRHNLR